MDEELERLIADADAEQEELNDDGSQDTNDEPDSNEDEGGDTSNDDDNLDNEGDQDGDDSDNGQPDADNSDDDSDDNIHDDDDDGEELDFEPIKVMVAGTEVEITSQEELTALATKGLTGNQQPRQDSEADMYMQQGELTQDDLKMLIAAKNGDANAIAKMAELGKVDIDAIDEAEPESYKPSFELTTQSEVDKVAADILSDDTHAANFKEIISGLPSDFVSDISSDASKLQAFSAHIKSGLAQETIPRAIKQMAINGGTFFEAYASIGQEIATQRANTREPNQIEGGREVSARERKMRNRANGSNRSGSSKAPKNEVEDILAMSDEDFDKMVSNSIR